MAGSTTRRRPSHPDLEFGEPVRPAEAGAKARPGVSPQRDSWQDLFAAPAQETSENSLPSAFAEELDPLDPTEMIEGDPLAGMLEREAPSAEVPVAGIARAVEQAEAAAKEDVWGDSLSADGDLFGEVPTSKKAPTHNLGLPLEGPKRSLTPSNSDHPTGSPPSTPAAVRAPHVPPPPRMPAAEDERPTRLAPTKPGAPPSAPVPKSPRMPTLSPDLEYGDDPTTSQHAAPPPNPSIEFDFAVEAQPSPPPLPAPPPSVSRSSPTLSQPSSVARVALGKSSPGLVKPEARPATANPIAKPAPASAVGKPVARSSPVVQPNPVAKGVVSRSSPGTATPAALRPRMPAPPAAPSEPDSTGELRDRFALGDYSGALLLGDALSESQRTPEVRRILDESRVNLQQMYLSRLGALHQRPTLAITRAELKWLSLDHRAGFVLSLVDGMSTLEDILDLSNMPTLDALRILYELHTQRVIELKD